LLLDAWLSELPPRGAKLTHGGKDVGYVTSAIRSPRLNAPIALGYVRRDVNQSGSVLKLEVEGRVSTVTVTNLPFGKGSD
jgi:glycine cleavage system aminomethyltransferase T